jgi:predicted RNA-binding protein with PIN domain
MYEWIIVDGNNLLHSDRAHLFGDVDHDFEAARWGLARILDELSGEMAQKMTIVFDGKAGGKDEAFQGGSLDVIFAPSEMTADTVIERMVAKATTAGNVMVVSSDKAERYTVGATGAQTMSCDHFIEFLVETQRNQARHLKRRSQRLPKSTLGDFFPPSLL